MARVEGFGGNEGDEAGEDASDGMFVAAGKVNFHRFRRYFSSCRKSNRLYLVDDVLRLLANSLIEIRRRYHCKGNREVVLSTYDLFQGSRDYTSYP